MWGCVQLAEPALQLPCQCVVACYLRPIYSVWALRLFWLAITRAESACMHDTPVVLNTVWASDSMGPTSGSDSGLRRRMGHGAMSGYRQVNCSYTAVMSPYPTRFQLEGKRASAKGVGAPSSSFSGACVQLWGKTTGSMRM